MGKGLLGGKNKPSFPVFNAEDISVKNKTKNSSAKRFWSIRYKVILLVAFMMFFTVAALSTSGFFLVYNMRSQAIGESIQMDARLASEALADAVEEKMKALRVYFADPEWKEFLQEVNAAREALSPEEREAYFKKMDLAWPGLDAGEWEQALNGPMNARLKNYASEDDQIAEIFVTDRYGGLAAASGKTTDFFQADETWWQDASKGEEGLELLRDVSFDESSGILALDMTTSIKDKKGNVIGFAKQSVNTEEFFKLLDRYTFKETGHAVLLNSYGDVLFHEGVKPLSVKVFDEKTLQKVLYDKRGWIILPGSSLHRHKILAGRARVDFPALATGRVQWYVITLLDEKEFFHPLKKIIAILALSGSAFFLFFFILGYVLSKKLVDPTRQLHKAILEVQKGNWDYPLEIHTGDEVEELADSFRALIKHLRQRQLDLAKAREEVEVLSQSLEEKIEARTQDLSQSQRATMNIMEDLAETNEKIRRQTEELERTQKELEEKAGRLEEASAALKESEKRFMDVLYASEDAILLIDGDLFVDCNKATAKMLGYFTREECLMKHPSELSPLQQSDGRNSFDKANEMMQIAFREGFNRFEWVHRKANGEDFPVEVSLTPVVMHGKTVLHCLWRDLTEHKKAEEALRSSRELLNATGQIARVGGWEFDPEKKSLSWTDEVFRILELEVGAAPGLEKGIAFYAPESQPLIKKALKKALETGELFDLELEVIPVKTKKKIWVRVSGEAVHEHGKIARLRGTMQDIDERKRAEDALRASEARYKSYLEVTGQIGWTTRPDGAVEDMPEWRKYTGQTVEEIKGWGWLNAMHPDDRERTAKIWQKAVAEKNIYETEYRIRRADGIFRYFLARGIPSFYDNGAVREWVGTCIDITERKRSEDELKRQAKELEMKSWGLQKANEGIKALYQELEAKSVKLEKLDKMKDEFVSIVAHELRSPLSVIHEAAALIMDGLAGPVSEQQKGYIEMVRRTADRLIHITNDLLDLAKIEAGKIVLNFEPMDIISAARQACEGSRLRANKKNLEIREDFPDERLQVTADYDKLSQVMVNLLTNAVKFTQKGSVTFEIKDLGGEVQCAVRDTGPGIAEENLSRLFNKFEQFGAQAGGAEKGSGLGLVISKSIVEAHGGRIWAESQPGKGSSFIFVVPKQPKRKRKLGEILVEDKTLTPEQLDEALRRQKEHEEQGS
jgi:PAS domain S-box-containing protein